MLRLPKSGESCAPLTRGRLAAAVSGLVFAVSTPPLDLQVAILLGLSGVAASLANARSAARPLREGALRGFGFGFTANLLALRFVPEVISRFTSLPTFACWIALLLLAAMQALPWLAAGALTVWLAHPSALSRRRGVPAFLAFGAGVYASTFFPSVFPWTPAGGLSRWPELLQTADLLGERGVSLLVALASGLFADGIGRVVRADDRTERGRGVVIASCGVGVLGVLGGYGVRCMRDVDALREAAPRARVALVSPDFDAMVRWEEHRATWMMNRLSALTKRAEESGAALTIWPESAYPYTLAHGTNRSPVGTRAILQQGVSGPVLTGAYLSKGDGLGTNSAILVHPDAAIDPSYDKRHLLWFGETIPFADVLPILLHVFARGTGIVAGTESVLFRSGSIRAAVLNCYEDTLVSGGREAMEVAPNLLVNLTNDAWFAGSSEGELHLRLSVLRSIETRRDLVRAVNRGPTSWVDAAGRVRARREGEPGVGPVPPLVVDVALLETPPTLYVRLGDTPLLLLGALTGAFFWTGRRRSPCAGAERSRQDFPVARA